MRKTPPSSFAATLLCVLVGLSCVADAAELRPQRVESGPRLDGMLDEALWQEAALAQGFVQQRPHTGEPASQATEVRVLYSASALYFGFVCHDHEPERIVRQTLGRDASVWDDDYLAVVIDSFHDRQNGFFFQVNPNGVRRDALFRAEGSSDQFNSDWDGVWRAAIRVTESGWQGEIEIPWRTLRFPTGERISMGLNFERQRRSVNEQSHWAPVERQFNILRVSAAGSMAGLSGIRPGSNILLRPYLSGTLGRGDADDGHAWDGDDWSSDGELGYDVKLGLTSNLTLDITVNTDFAQVEVDDEEINLTRFPLDFPEKREFFLENRDFFAFGSPANRAFYSRRIGLDAHFDAVPIEYGTRLTGKLGRTDLGLLDISTDSRHGMPAQRFDVARLSRDVGHRSRVGGIAVNRQGEDDNDFNRVFGLDTDLRPTDDLDIAAYGMFSHSPGDGPDKGAGGTRARWSRPLFNATFLQEIYGADYSPDVGFLPRGGISRTDAELGWTPEPNLGPLRSMENFVFMEWIDRRHRGFESRNLWVQATLMGHGQETLALWVSDSFERLFEPFELGGDVEFAPGDYDFLRWGVEASSDPSRAISGELEFIRGDFFDGELEEMSATLIARWAPHLSVLLEGERNRGERIDGPSGLRQRFAADLLRLRLGVDLSNQLSVDLFTQWNGEEDLLLSQLRIHYLFGDESDLFLVVGDARDDGHGNYAPRRSEATLKLAYSLRL